jgi:nucleotide-binding universal stress UspA family protein
MYTKLLWATDGSPVADRALAEGLQVLAPDGEITAFHCDQRYVGALSAGIPVAADEPETREAIEAKVEELKRDGVAVELIVSSRERPAAAIVETADEVGAQAIVCGTRGLGAVQSTVLGSVAKALLHDSHLPLLIVPANVAEAAAAVAASAGEESS